MSDKKITIGIETTANTSGAKQAVTAIDGVADKAKELDAALDKVPGNGLDAIPPKAKQAEKSIKDVQIETNKLGKGGNSGRALLEFSRAFEDAQFGINGILNNLPGLIAALGGTAGLAGIISIVAVAGSVLWGNFGKGTKKAKVETEELTERLAGMLKVYREFAALGAEDREKAADAVAETLKDKLRSIDTKFKIDVGNEGVTASLAAAEAEIELAKDKLALSRVEAALIQATAEQAVKLAGQREEIVKRIYQDELRIGEIAKTQAVNVAQAKVTSADGKVQDTATAANTLDDQYRSQRIIVDGLRDEADRLQASRIFAIKAREDEKALLASQIKEMQKELDSTQSLDRANTLDALIGKAENRIQQIDKDSKDPKPLEKAIEAETKFKAEYDALKKLEPEIKASAEAQKAAADAMTSASLDLKNLRQTQNIQRTGEAQLKGIADAGAADQKIAGKTTAVVGQLDSLVGSIDESGGKDLAPFIAEMKTILQDKALSADELARVPTLLAQYFGKIANLGSAQNAAVRAAMERVDGLEREVRNLKITASQRNP